jgi:hypothetical protein
MIGADEPSEEATMSLSRKSVLSFALAVAGLLCGLAVPGGVLAAQKAFNAEAAKQALKKVAYADCKDAQSKGGDAMLEIKFAAKDGRVLSATFLKTPPVPYSDATRTCIVQRFERVTTKPFSGGDKTLVFRVRLFQA